MERFIDENGKIVTLSFKQDSFAKEPMHVLVICRYEDGWVLTKHRERGLEFPGGKVEKGETLEQAARREVYEETGAVLKSLHYLGEYEVGKDYDSFVKAIFYGVVERVEKKQNYLETDGPEIVDGNITQKRWGQEYSFIMRDDVIDKSIKYIFEHFSERQD